MRFLSEIYFISFFLICAFIGKKSNIDVFDLKIAQQTKGIASLLIMIGHSVSATSIKEIGFLNVGWYGVALFFFWSGYGVTYGYMKKKNYLRNFLLSRAIKILVPLMVVHFIYVPVKLLFGVEYSFYDFILSLLGAANIVDNSWYPIAVFIFYILFFICFSFKIKKKYQIILLSVSVVIVTAIECFVFTEKCNWWVISNLSFLIGVWTVDRSISGYRKSVVFTTIGIAFCLGYVSFPVFRRILGDSFAVRVLSDNLMSGALAFLVVYLFGSIGRICKLWLFLGNVSYEIYLIHGLFIFLFSRVLSVDTILLIIPLTIVCTTLSAYIINKIDGNIIRKIC